MRRALLFVIGLLAAETAGLAWPADAQRGAEVLRRENCLQCHNLHGEGGTAAPDLARRVGRGYTPAVLASLMWDHAPRMWEAMSARKVALPQLKEGDAEDLFAYLYSVRLFERPGDAGRGKQVFEGKHCSECHSLKPPAKGPGNPVANWKGLTDPIALVEAMWNHSSDMKTELAQRKKVWVSLSGQELTDLTVYLQNLPSLNPAPPVLTMASPASGKPLFDQNCAQCHKDSLALDRQFSGQTLMDVAAEMWNHVPRMIAAPMLSSNDMRQIVAYAWERQYLGSAGNVGHGRKTFVEKRCSSCHDDPSSAAPKTLRGEQVFTPLSMVPVVWAHGPQMLELMKQKGIAWPQLTPEDLSNLVAYLNTRP
jgi:mono/diheme cytochrome c family protein